MSGAHIRANEVQKTIEPVRQSGQELIRQQEQGPVQAVAPQAAYRRVQLNRNGLRPADMLALQRAVGNRMVQRMVAKANEEQQDETAEEDSERTVQTKLTVDAPKDVYEQETDRAAGRVMAMPEAAAQRPNRTGLPDGLKSGVESLSGMSMDGVKVHYNSFQPAQLNALAYAQGSDIHVAPGQEQHLPHEAWHVVQQAQGRVQPTMQMTDGVPVNDDQGLEREADVMGSRSAQGVSQSIAQRATTEAMDAIRTWNSPGKRLCTPVPRRASDQDLQVRNLVVQGNFIPSDVDPNEINAVTQIANAGTLNKGIFRLANAQGQILVVKFTDEDSARPEFADSALAQAGVTNTRSRGMSTASTEGAALAARIETVALGPLKAAVQNGRTAEHMVLMTELTELDFGVAFAGGGNFPANAVVTSNAFAQGLGKMFAADTMLGNSDRIVHNVTAGGADFVAINPGNFKVAANGVVSVLDNDTQLLSRELLQKVRERAAGVALYLDADQFADMLISGYRLDQNAPRGLFNNKGVQDLFNPAIGSLLAVELQNTLDAAQLANFNAATFAQQFNLGIAGAVQNLMANAAQFMQAAVAAGNPQIDPAALATKLSYTGARRGGAAHAAARTQGQLFAQMMVFDASLLPVPQIPAQGPVTKAIRGVTARSAAGSRLEVLKGEARAGNLDLGGLEERIEEARGLQGGEHRSAKTQFELGLRKAVRMMNERTAALLQADGEVAAFAVQAEVAPYLWLFDPNGSGQIDPQCPIRVAMLNKYHQVAMSYVGQLKVNSAESQAVSAAFNALRSAFLQLQANVINAGATLP